MRWRQWLVTFLLLIVAVLIIAYGLGKRLPEEHTAVADTTIAAPQAKVWALIADVDAQPQWRSGLKSIDELPPAGSRQRWTEHYKGAAMTFQLMESDPSKSRVVQLEPQGAAMDGEWIYQLMPLDDGRTNVAITEHGHLYSPLYRFMMHYVLGDTFNQKRYLRDLKAAAEK